MALEATDWMCEDDRTERPGPGVVGYSSPPSGGLELRNCWFGRYIKGAGFVRLPDKR